MSYPSHRSLPVKTLLERSAEGSQEARQLLLDRAYGWFVRYARKRFPAEGENFQLEVAHSAMLKVQRRLEEKPFTQSEYVGYALATIYTTGMDLLEKRQSTVKAETEYVLRQGGVKERVDCVQPLDLLYQQELAELIQRLLEGVDDPIARRAFELRVFAEEIFSEIAKLLELKDEERARYLFQKAQKHVKVGLERAGYGCDQS